MPRNGPTLILVHEPEKACFDRLVADGYPTERATEIGRLRQIGRDLGCA
ncbi:MAG: D-alanine:D-lactate ligase-like protein, partial [Mesorhizobium sp.]